MNLNKFGKVLTSKSVGTGPSSYEKRSYRAAVAQRLRNTGLEDCLCYVESILSSENFSMEIFFSFVSFHCVIVNNTIGHKNHSL